MFGLLEGNMDANDYIRIMSNRLDLRPVEIGVFSPIMLQVIKSIAIGDVGYIATGLKTVSECRVGDTITFNKHPAANRCRAITTLSQWYLLEFIL